MQFATIDLPAEKLADVCRRYGVKELSAFGSVLRHDFRPDSDVDLLIDLPADHGLDLVDYINLQEEFAAILGRRVDLVDKQGLKPALRQPILNSAQVIYAK
jgi:predicted nucleotidyltransferase